MTKKLRVAPAFLIQPGAVIDDGETLSNGPRMDAVAVPVAELEGCAFYTRFMAEFEQLQAAYAAGQEPEQIEVPDSPPST